MPDPFPATRHDAFARLDAFSAHVKRYAGARNFLTPGYPNVSRLSAAIRHRLITEEEVIAFLLDRHPFSAIEKFLQEVCWRTYWKGYLAQHPAVWHDATRLAQEPLSPLAEKAIAGTTGCTVMDDFAGELRDTGYLHNHARMWWAAYWIHHLQLPWAQGAQFFLDHLLDADPASNTLSWRWVAGLHTPGKAYLARPDNIAKYHPQHHPQGLDALAAPQAHIPTEHADLTSQPLPQIDTHIHFPLEKYALLVHAEDLSIEHSALTTARPAAILLLDHRPPNTSAARHAWLDAALADARTRLSAHFAQPITTLHHPTELDYWSSEHNITQFITISPQVGPLDDLLRSSFPANLSIHQIQRPWDRDFYPAARSGFFPFWKKVSRADLFTRSGPQQVFSF